MSKDDIKAAIMVKKAIMAAEKRSTEKRKGSIVPSYFGGARNDFEERAKFTKAVSGKRYASDAAINKLGRS